MLSLELTGQGNSNEYPQHVFVAQCDKNCKLSSFSAFDERSIIWPNRVFLVQQKKKLFFFFMLNV